MVDNGQDAQHTPLNAGRESWPALRSHIGSLVLLTCEFSPPGPRVIYVDEGVAELIGSTPDRLRGAAFGDLLAQPFGANELLRLRQALSRGIPWRTVVALRGTAHQTLGLELETASLWGIADIAFAATLRDERELPSSHDTALASHAAAATIHDFGSTNAREPQPELISWSSAEQRFRAATTSDQDGYLTLTAQRDLDGKICDFIIVDSNQNAATMLNSTVCDLVGRAMSEALAPAHKHAWFSRCAEILETGVPRLETRPGAELGLATKWVRWHAVPLSEGVALSLCDVSWERELSIQLSKSSRLEAIGSLAISIAHDFNNTLSAIIGFGELARDALPLNVAPRNDVEQVVDAAQRAAQLTRFLLAFGKRQPLEPQLVDVSETLGTLRQLLTRLAGPTVCLEMVLESPATCWADPSQLEQAIVNLVVNARDAMPCGGSLRICVQATSLQTSPAMGLRVRDSNHFVCVSVSDNGVGMDAQTRTRIFEPFFTTKGDSGGTGLGLASVYGFVKQSGGAIFVDSEVGQGTTFRLLFPFVDGAPFASPSSALPLSGSWARATGTVLVVEQDPAVRTVVRRALELNRFSVVEANSVEQARLRLKNESQPIEILLTALKLFGCSGIDLARWSKSESPTTGIVLMSGAAEMDEVQQAAADVGALFIQKPFSADVLLSKVQSALAQR